MPGSQISSMLMSQFVGPPEPRSRFDNIPESPRRVPAVEDESLGKILLPLIISQGIDFLSTEKPLGFNRRDDMSETANKFPGARSQGFAGTAGRIGSGLLELAMAAAALRAVPKARKAYIIPSASSHVEYAKRNWSDVAEREMRERLGGR